VGFDIVPALTDHPVVTIVVTTPAGPLSFMAQLSMRGETMVLDGLHVQDSRANAIGIGNLMVLAQAVMEGMDLDGIVVNGAPRSTGANPGRTPRNLRFTRRVRPAPPGD
jgi:hypothetical protein